MLPSLELWRLYLGLGCALAVVIPCDLNVVHSSSFRGRVFGNILVGNMLLYVNGCLIVGDMLRRGMIRLRDGYCRMCGIFYFWSEMICMMTVVLTLTVSMDKHARELMNAIADCMEDA